MGGRGWLGICPGLADIYGFYIRESYYIVSHMVGTTHHNTMENERIF